MIPRSLIVLIAEEDGSSRAVHPSVIRNQEELERRGPSYGYGERFPGYNDKSLLDKERERFLGSLNAKLSDLYKKEPNQF
jgi:hypothetical protein